MKMHSDVITGEGCVGAYSQARCLLLDVINQLQLESYIMIIEEYLVKIQITFVTLTKSNDCQIKHPFYENPPPLKKYIFTAMAT